MLFASAFSQITQLPRSRHARRQAHRVLAPCVRGSRARLGQIPDLIWFHPYVVGFLVSNVTVIALDASRRRLSDDALGRVQTQCWQDLSGLRGCDIGDDITLYSLGSSPEFAAGVEASFRYLAALGRDSHHMRMAALHHNLKGTVFPARDADLDATGVGHDIPIATALRLRNAEDVWIDCFDEPVSRLIDHNGDVLISSAS